MNIVAYQRKVIVLDYHDSNVVADCLMEAVDACRKRAATSKLFADILGHDSNNALADTLAILASRFNGAAKVELHFISGKESES